MSFLLSLFVFLSVAFLMGESVLIGLNLSMPSRRFIHVSHIRRISFRIFMIVFILTLYYNDLRHLPILSIAFILGLIIFEVFRVKGIKYIIVNLVQTIGKLGVFTVVFGLFQLGFFVLIHPLFLIGLLVVTLVLMITLLVPKMLNSIKKKFKFTPFIHSLEDSFFKEVMDKSDVYMIESSKMFLGTNAILFNIRHFTAMFLSKGLLIRMSSRKVEGIMAHEIGHGVNNHLRKRVGVSVIMLVLLLGVNITFHELYYESLSDFTFWLSISLMNYVVLRSLSIGFLMLLHQQEYQADAHAFYTPYEKGLYQALVQLNKSTDDKYYHALYTRFFRTHPSLTVRLKQFPLVK